MATPDLLDEFLATIGRKRTDAIRPEDARAWVIFLQSKDLAPGKQIVGGSWLGDHFGNVFAQAAYQVTKNNVGKPWATLPTSYSKVITTGEALQLGGLPDPTGLVSFDWVGPLFSYAAALLLLVAGLWLYTRGQPQRLTVVQA